MESMPILSAISTIPPWHGGASAGFGGGPTAPRAVLPFYASGNPSSGSVALHGGKSFSPCLSGGLGGASGFIAPLMKVSAAMEQVSMIKGNLEQVTTFLKTPKLVRPTEPAKLGGAVLSI